MRGVEASSYSLQGPVPAIFMYGNLGHDLEEELGGTPCQSAPGREPIWVRPTLGFSRPQVELPRLYIPLED
jgi:hypothetical protein